MASFHKQGGKWRARVRRHGRPDMSKTFAHKSDAQRWAREVEADIDRGVWHDTAASPASGITLGEMLEVYSDFECPKHRGCETERSQIRTWLCDAAEGGHPLRDRMVAEIRVSEVQGWINLLVAKGLRPGTVRKQVGLVRRVINKAMSPAWGCTDLPRNPVVGVELPREDEESERARRLRTDEYRLLRRALNPEARMPPGVLPARKVWPLHAMDIAIDTALRRGELLALRWQDISFEARIAEIPKTKSRRRRTIPLPPVALAALKAMKPQPSGLVFRERAGDALKTAWRRGIDRARAIYHAECRDTGMEPDPSILADLRWHDLRHEAISRLLEDGLNPIDTMSVSGHLDMRMLKRYSHPQSRRIADHLHERRTTGPDDG